MLVGSFQASLHLLKKIHTQSNCGELKTSGFIPRTYQAECTDIWDVAWFSLMGDFLQLIFPNKKYSFFPLTKSTQNHNPQPSFYLAFLLLKLSLAKQNQVQTHCTAISACFLNHPAFCSPKRIYLFYLGRARCSLHTTLLLKVCACPLTIGVPALWCHPWGKHRERSITVSVLGEMSKEMCF